MWKILTVIALSLLMNGCQTSSQNQVVYVWARADMKRITGNPQLEQQIELDKTICLGETQKSAVGMTPIYYNGLGGAINAAIIENQRGSALKDVAKGCMAAKGYIYITREEAEARIASIDESIKAPKSGDRTRRIYN